MFSLCSQKLRDDILRAERIAGQREARVVPIDIYKVPLRPLGTERRLPAPLRRLGCGGISVVDRTHCKSHLQSH